MLGSQLEKMNTVCFLYIDLEMLLQPFNVLRRLISCFNQGRSVTGSLPPQSGVAVSSQLVARVKLIISRNIEKARFIIS